MDPVFSEVLLINTQNNDNSQSLKSSFEKIRSQSVDFDIQDSTPRSLSQFLGCGFLWKNKSTIDTDEEFQVQVQDVLAVYSSSFQYCHIFTALAIRDYFDEFFNLEIPVRVIVSDYSYFISFSFF